MFVGYLIRCGGGRMIEWYEIIGILIVRRKNVGIIFF